MKLPVTRNDLYGIRKQIIALQNENQALALLLSKEINRFFAVAGPELKITDARFNSILVQHAEVDENGKPKAEEVDGVNKWKFRGSITQEDRTIILGKNNVEEAFNKTVHALMKQTVIIDW